MNYQTKSKPIKAFRLTRSFVRPDDTWPDWLRNAWVDEKYGDRDRFPLNSISFIPADALNDELLVVTNVLGRMSPCQIGDWVVLCDDCLSTYTNDEFHCKFAVCDERSVARRESDYALMLHAIRARALWATDGEEVIGTGSFDYEDEPTCWFYFRDHDEIVNLEEDEYGLPIFNDDDRKFLMNHFGLKEEDRLAPPVISP